MQCDECKGKGYWMEPRTDSKGAHAFDFLILCKECRGSGIVYCCEGEHDTLLAIPSEALVKK